LIRGLYDRGLDRQDILNLYKFIDWSMLLSKGLEQTFWQELKAFEEGRKVTYVTTGERIGFEQGALQGRQEGIQEGIQEGRQEGELTLVLRQLPLRVGKLTPEAEAQVRALSLVQLEALGEALLDFSQPSDLRDWLG
jgi:flagellar biosynthesis/type III secretory pathway protein FliH